MPMILASSGESTKADTEALVVKTPFPGIVNLVSGILVEISSVPFISCISGSSIVTGKKLLFFIEVLIDP